MKTKVHALRTLCGVTDKGLRKRGVFQYSIGVVFSITALLALLGAAETARGFQTSVFWILAGNLLLPLVLWAQRSVLGQLKRPKILLMIMALSLFCRLLAIVVIPNSPVSDFEAYHELAIGLKSFGSYSLTGPAGKDDAERYLGGGLQLPRPTAFRAPGAPLWGAVLGGSELAFKLANSMFGAITGVLIYLLLEPIGSGPATFAGMLWALYPSSIFATLLYGTEVLYSFLVVLAAWLVSRQWKDKITWASSVGLCLAACALVRPPAMIVWLPACGALLRGDRKDAVRRVALLTSFFIAGLAPWTIRNWLSFHRFIPISTSQGIAFGRHTAIYSRIASQPIAAPGDEMGLAEGGWLAGIQNVRNEAGSGAMKILRDVGGNLRHCFGTDSDLIRWATLQRYEPAVSPQPDANRVLSQPWLNRWLIINQSFYSGLLLFAAAAILFKPKQEMFAHEGILFLLWHFLLFWIVLSVVPGVNRYHFSLIVPIVLIASSWGTRRAA